jgi:hypothetical protein
MQCSAAAQQVAQREACGARVRRSGAMVCVVSAVSRRVAEQRSVVSCCGRKLLTLLSAWGWAAVAFSH